MDSDTSEQNAERNNDVAIAEEQNIRPMNAPTRHSAWDAVKVTQRGTENAVNGKKSARDLNNLEQPHSPTSSNDPHAQRGTKHRHITVQPTQEPTTNTEHP